jgi:hypothetical protein
VLALFPACRNAGNAPASKSTRWSDLASSFENSPSTTPHSSPSAESRPTGSEHFRNIAGQSPPLSLDLQAQFDQQELVHEPNGRLKMNEDRAYDQNRKWKQYWRDNPNDVPVMSKWFRDDYR